MRSPRRLAAATLAVIGSIVATLLLLEIALRVLYVFDPNTVDALMNARTAPPGDELTLGDIIRLTDDPRIAYELRPGIEGEFRGIPLSVNSLGMRGPDRTWSKEAGTFRIAALGDSHTFGWGVANQDTFVSVLARRLDERLPKRRVEAWNLGVPGYNTVQEVADLERRIDRLKPDLLVLLWVANDADLPNFLRKKPDPWTLEKSYLRDLVRRRLKILRGRRVLPLDLLVVDADEHGRYMLDRTRVPEEYWRLFGHDHMMAALRRLAEIAGRGNLPLVIVFDWNDVGPLLRGETDNVLPEGVRQIARQCEAMGYLVVDTQHRMARYLESHNLPPSALWVSGEDPHPNAARHRLIAEEILATLDQTGIHLTRKN